MPPPLFKPPSRSPPTPPVPRPAEAPPPVAPTGLQVVPNTCNTNDAAQASTGILHSSYLAGAAINAAAQFGTVPFNYFFPSTVKAANTVAAVMNRVIQSQLGQNQRIGVRCNDFAKLCQHDRNGVNLGYASQAPGANPSIILCRHGLMLPPNPPPCSGRPGTQSIGWLLLHEMAHIHSIAGPGLEIVDQTGGLAFNVGNAVKAGQDTTTDAAAYAYLGTWAWDLGLGGPPWNQKRVCLEKFATGQFTANAYVMMP